MHNEMSLDFYLFGQFFILKFILKINYPFFLNSAIIFIFIFYFIVIIIISKVVKIIRKKYLHFEYYDKDTSIQKYCELDSAYKAKIIFF